MFPLQKHTVQQLQTLKEALEEDRLEPLPIEAVAETYRKLTPEVQLRICCRMLDELIQQAKFDRNCVIMFDRRKMARASLDGDETGTNPLSIH